MLLGTYPFKNWLQNNLTTKTTLFVYIPWSTLFAYSCWMIWKELPIAPSLHSILNLTTEFINIITQFNPLLPTTTDIYIKWHLPLVSFHHSKHRWILHSIKQTRRSTGKWLAGFTANFFYSSSNQTEIWAFKCAVEIAISQRLNWLKFSLISNFLSRLLNMTHYHLI